MKRNSLVFLVIIALIPVILTGIFGWRILCDEQRRSEVQFRELSQAGLVAIDQQIGATVRSKEIEFLQLFRTLHQQDLDNDTVVWQIPLVRQIWTVENGRVDASSSNGARPMLEKLLQHVSQITDEVPPSAQISKVGRATERLLVQSSAPEHQTAFNSKYGWFVWYADSAIRPVFWQMIDENTLYALELITPALLSDIVADLPQDRDPSFRIRLLGSNQEVLHQWGGQEPSATARPVAEIALSAPFGSWRLQQFALISQANRWAGTVFFVAALLLISTVTLGGAGLFYREHTREISAALQRVNFVNQVSHELKTPLTSIRMYAELLEQNLPDDDEENRRFLSIVTHESQRLSRLISNVLTFAGLSRGKQGIHLAPGCVDDVVRTVSATCQPALQSRGISIEMSLGAPSTVTLDTDLVGQILHNLLSNVEKYAADGQRVVITTRWQDGQSVITVRDFGPGIPQAAAERIFEPFYRVHSTLTEGVSGTGIGLNIARDLARLHGGDLELVPCTQGACFLCSLDTPLVEEPHEHLDR